MNREFPEHGERTYRLGSDGFLPAERCIILRKKRNRDNTSPAATLCENVVPVVRIKVYSA